MGNTGPKPASPEEFFWARVEKNGPVIYKHLGPCWIWMGSINNGYGYGSVGGSKKLGTRRMQAHRLSWILHHGPIPDGLLVCHKCDNPPCVCPTHLFIGTQTDNLKDSYVKGRKIPPRPKLEDRPRGEKMPNHKLTWTKVDNIRRLYKEGISRAELGRQFGVSSPVIFHIVHNNKWKEEFRPLC